MHFMILTAVNVPQIEEDEKENAEVRKHFENEEKKGREYVKSGRWSEEWGEIKIGMLWKRYYCLNTTFSRAVFEQLEKVMKPYVYDFTPGAVNDHSSACDYFTVGGRFWGVFPVRESCKEVVLGERSSLAGTAYGLVDRGTSVSVFPPANMEESEEDADMPEGYVRVSAARKKDIDWELLRELANWGEERYPILTQAYAFIDNGVLQVPGKDEPDEEWAERVNAYMDSLPDDALIAIIDGGEN